MLTEDSEHVSKIVRKKLQKERVENAMKNGGQRVAIDLTLSDEMSNKVSLALTSHLCKLGVGEVGGCGEGNLCKSEESLNFPISVHPVPGMRSFPFSGRIASQNSHFSISHIY